MTNSTPAAPLELDEKTQGILHSLVNTAKRSKAAAAQAANQFRIDDQNISSYFAQLCERSGLDPKTHEITADLTSIVAKTDG